MAKPATHQNVVRLDVGVHDLEAMQVLQRREHLLAVPDGSKQSKAQSGGRHIGQERVIWSAVPATRTGPRDTVQGE